MLAGDTSTAFVVFFGLFGFGLARADGLRSDALTSQPERLT
jgi:hypothetical protein